MIHIIEYFSVQKHTLKVLLGADQCEIPLSVQHIQYKVDSKFSDSRIRCIVASLRDVPSFGRTKVNRWSPAVTTQRLPGAAGKHLTAVFAEYHTGKHMDIFPLHRDIAAWFEAWVSGKLRYNFLLAFFWEQSRMMVFKHDEILLLIRNLSSSAERCLVIYIISDTEWIDKDFMYLNRTP